VSSQGHREEIIADLFTQVKDPQKGLLHGGIIRHAEHINFAVLPINDLSIFLKSYRCCRELLVSFYRANGSRKPSRIIFYRFVIVCLNELCFFLNLNLVSLREKAEPAIFPHVSPLLIRGSLGQFP